MELVVTKINKHEFVELMQIEANKEGWLYSQYDVDFYFNNPYNHISAISVNNHLAGCVILHQSPGHVQGKAIRSAGLFLVINKYRGMKMVGPYLWQKGVTEFLNKDMLVCFHSVPRAVLFYARLGFLQTPLITQYYLLKLNEYNNSMHDDAKTFIENGLIKIIDKNNLDEIDSYTKSLFPNTSGIGFCEFIHQWTRRPDAMTVAYYENNNVTGYGMATICNQRDVNGKDELCYRISPVYANSAEIASDIVQSIVYLLLQANAKQIELYSLATAGTLFGDTLTEIGFSAMGKNYVVCNYPELVKPDAEILDNVFCSLPFEYPHEVAASL